VTVGLGLLAMLGTASLVTAFISGILGMAGGMILMGILLAALPLSAAMTLHGLTQFTSNGGRAWMLRREIHWPVAIGYACGGLAAFALFAALRLQLGKGAALLAIGLTPFLGLALPARLRLDVLRRGHAFACGLACVALSLTAGIAGPILDVFFVRSAMGRRAVVATKALTQCLSHLLKVGYFGALVGMQEALPVVPAVAMASLAVVGTLLSRGVLERMTDASFRQWSRGTVLALGVIYLAAGAMLAG
jgi:hypothetical protein